MALVRTVCFGLDFSDDRDDLQVGVGTFGWAQAPNGNTASKAFTCAYVPPAKGSGSRYFQETMFIGGLNVGEMLQTFRSDITDDDNDPLEVELITARIVPEEDKPSDTSRYCWLDFPDIDPEERGAEVEFAKNAESPHQMAPAWTELDTVSGNSKRGIPSGIARWLNLRIVATGVPVGVPFFNGFVVGYYPLGHRDARTT